MSPSLSTVLHDRRGVTLIELLVTLVVAGIVSAAVYQVIGGQIRITERLSAREAVQQNARAALELISSELRGVPAGGILVAEEDEIRFRSPRAWGVVCAVDGGNLYAAFPSIDGVGIFSEVAVAVAGAVGPEMQIDSTGNAPASVTNADGEQVPLCTPEGPQQFGKISGWQSHVSDPVIGDAVYLYRVVGYRQQGDWIQRGRFEAEGGQTWEAFAGPVAGNGLRFGWDEDENRIEVEVVAEERGEERTASIVVHPRNVE